MMLRMLIVVLVCVIAAGLETTHAQTITNNPEYVTFTLKNSTAFPGRDAHTAVIVGNTLVVAAGEDANRIALNDVWISTPPDSGVFSQVNVVSKFTARADHSTVVNGNKIIIMAGQFNGTVLYNDVWASIDTGATWTQTVAAAPWAPRIGAMAVLYNGAIIMVGGFLETSVPSVHCSEVWSSTDDGATWKLISNNSFTGRADARVDVVGNALVMTGGENKPPNTFSEVWRSTDGGVTWTLVNPSAPWGPRFQHTSAVVDGQLILTTGLYTNFTVAANDVWASRDAGTSWTQVTSSAGFLPRAHAESVVYQAASGPIFILTGGNKGGGAQVYLAHGAPLVIHSAANSVFVSVVTIIITMTSVAIALL